MSTVAAPSRPPAATTLPASTPAPAAAPKPVSAPAKPISAAPTPAKSRVGVPEGIRRPTVDPKRALGLPESPRASIDALVAASRVRNKLDQPLPGAAPAPVHPASAPIVAAPTPTLETPAPEVAPAVPTPSSVPTATPHPNDALIAKMQKELDELKKAKEPAPAAAPAPVVPVEAPETPEQARKRQDDWVQERTQHIPVDMTSDEMDTILGGGEEAVAAMTGIRKRDIARSVLEARTSIYAEVNPVVDELRSAVTVLLKNHMDVQRFTIETQFFGKYPEMETQRPYCNEVANYLMQLYPQECSKLTPDQFIDYLHTETVKLLDTQAQRLGLPSWKDAQAARAAAVAPAVPVPAVPVAAVPIPGIPALPTHISAPGPTGPVAMPRPVAPTTPPSPHSPGAMPIGAPGKNWSSSVAMDLRN